MKRIFILALSIAVAGCASHLFAADNVVLFIGDGMGFNHVKAGRVLVNGSSAAQLNFEGLGVSAESITVLPDGTITDSATAGTALATGYQHPVNGVISMGANNSIKTTILEFAKARGFRTGIITTDDIGGATPGAFGAHEPDRTYMSNIRHDYLVDDTTYGHAASLPNLLLGGGYNDPALVLNTGLTYAGLGRSLGYSFVTTASDLDSATSQPLIGLFGTTWAPMASMVSRPDTQPRFSEMVTKALNFLKNEQGFFLIAESANIDKLSHSNDKNFVYEVAELDQAVQAALAWKNAQSTDNTLILVTADHETGGLTVPDQTLPVGSIPSMTWSTTGHSTRNVPIFATWPAALQGLTVDNTEVFYMLEDYLNISSGGKPPVIAQLNVDGVTTNSATIQWDTAEPSTTQIYQGTTLVLENTARVTHHSTVLDNLAPGTQFQLVAASRDIAGNTGSADVSFQTKAMEYNDNARVIAEPVVGIGVISGTIAGVAASNDGVTQLVTEATSGAGSRLSVEYTLHTDAAVASIESLTLNGVVNWTARDGTADQLITEIRVNLPGGDYGWEPITFPFQVVPVTGCLDANGNLVVRFSDSASIKRERKDVLTVDYLQADVVIGSVTSNLPTTPGALSASAITAKSVTLTWTDSQFETGYAVWRYTASSGWTVAAELPADTTTYTDQGLASGASITYVVRALNGDGYADSVPLVVEIPAVLTTPENLKASVTKGAINLSWTDSNTIETGYQVLRGTTADGNFEILATLKANATSYADQTVTRGTKYYYQVRAIKDAELGPVSATVSATAR